ncbi:MAG: phosphoribosylglycinamide formyltransferase-1 [Parvibaculaceae bacterium]|jgi:phosphoribosylglycinamide formyltransferase-1|nr:phosphoribosylglycinamide formyltransferase [Parvibaculaceae bacterium]
MKVGVLISGRGSNLQALIDACAEADFPAEIVTVISNRPNVGGLELAEAAGIPHQVINHKDFEDRESFDGALDEALQAAGVELICSAGFMRILTDGFVEKWRNKQLNIHPSLLPSFKGLHVHERSIEAGVRISGCTVHFVRAEMDDGPIVAQAAVPVHSDDTASTLAARILVAEHKIYPLALKLVAEGKARVVGEKVVFSGLDETEEAPVLSHPQ